MKVNDAPKINDIFGDLFENKILMTDDENLLNHLLTKMTDATVSHVAPEVKYVLIKTEEIKPKFEDVVIKKNTWKSLPQKTETIFADIKPKIKMPQVKLAIEPFPITNDWLDNLDSGTKMFVGDNYIDKSLTDDLPDIKPDLLDNVHGQTEKFVDEKSEK